MYMNTKKDIGGTISNGGSQNSFVIGGFLESEATAEVSLPDKHEDFSEWYGEILQRANLVDIRYGLKGFIVYRPNIMYIIKRIYETYEVELEATKHKPVLFPVVIPYAAFKKEADHIKGFQEEVFWVSKAGGHELEEPGILRPTSETAMYPIYSLWVRSYKDLPLKVYQSCAVYRYETKATKPLIRGREFLWIEAHTLHRDEKGAMGQVTEDMEIAKKVLYEHLGLPFILVQREDFDKFYGAVSSFAFDVLLPDLRVLQVATTHYLGTKFSVPFEVRYLDEDGQSKYPHTTCYGPGISRIAAAAISVHGDGFGAVLPFDGAPVQIVIIPIPKEGFQDRIFMMCRDLEKLFRSRGFRAQFDDSDARPGEKFYRWELLGTPVRIEVGPRDLEENAVTVFRRDTRTRATVKESELADHVDGLRQDILLNLRKNGEAFLKDNMHVAMTKQKLMEIAKKGGIAKIRFCGRKECADEMKAETEGFEVRGMDVESHEKAEGSCTWCGFPAVHVAFAARAY